MLENRLINFFSLLKGKHHFFYLLQINYDLRGFALQQHNSRGETVLRPYNHSREIIYVLHLAGFFFWGGGLEKTAIISTKVHHLYDHYKKIKNHGCIN